MRTLNYRLITFIIAAALFGSGCADDVLQGTGGSTAPNSGTVSQKNFNVVAAKTSLSVYDAATNTYKVTQTTISATIGDRKNQTLTDSHTIYFETEYGLIDPSCVTKNGTCSVTWNTSSFDPQNFPANDTGGAFTGSPAVTIIAYTGGEEGYTDFNNNDLYDDFDGGFIDIEEPYVDTNNNAVYDLTDIIIDTVNGNDVYGINKAHDIADGFFNGPGCTHSTNCSALVRSAMVWDEVVIKLDGGTVAKFSVGGDVTGLTGSMVLQNGADTLPVSTNGPFTFAAGVDNSTSYAVLISTQPIGQTCTVTNGTGTIASADVINVAVNCVSNFNVSGNVTGLTGSVTLQNNGADDQVINADGAVNFTPIPDGSAYSITVSSQPVGQDCNAITGGSNNDGTGTIATADVTNIAVNCISLPYTIGGTISGLTGNVTLQNNGADDLTVTANGSFTFLTSDITGNPYDVTVLTQPVGQSCSVTGGTGTISGANLISISVSCVSDTYTIGGIITGLAGTVSLTNNGGDLLNFSTPGTNSYTMPTAVPNISAYDIQVLAQPTGQLCTVSNGIGSVAGANVINVNISCVQNDFTIGGTISGLSGSVTLQNNLGDNLIVGANGTFTFATPLTNASPYSVTVLSQPNGQTCTVTGGGGIVSSANVTGVGISCANNPYNISGTLSGLSGSVTLQNNGGDNLVLNTNGTFTFATQINNGSGYNVTVLTKPANQVCTVTNGIGTVIGLNVTDITVGCATIYTVGANVSGLTGSMILQNNGGDDLVVNANGTFTFATGLLDTAAYSVTVLTQPAGQTCTVTSGSGSITAADVTVSVTCANNTISGAITGLTGTVTLQNNGGDDLILTAPIASFTFITPVDNGAVYGVTVSAQPITGEICTVTSGSGTVTGPVTTVTVNCI